MLSVVTKSEQPELSHVIERPINDRSILISYMPDAWAQIESSSLKNPSGNGDYKVWVSG